MVYFCGGMVVADEETKTGAVDPGVIGRSIRLGNVVAIGILLILVLVTGTLLVTGGILAVVVVTVVIRVVLFFRLGFFSSPDSSLEQLFFFAN